jgi:hypothetical protein
MARVLTWIDLAEYLAVISEAIASSFDWVRETRTRLKPLAAS